MTPITTDRLSILDKQQLLNPQTNARRLQAEAGVRANQAIALLPLIEAELSRRGADAPVKARPKRAR